MTKAGDEKEAAFSKLWHHIWWAKQNTERQKKESALITLLVDKHFLTFLEIEGFAECAILFLNTGEYCHSLMCLARRYPSLNALLKDIRID